MDKHGETSSASERTLVPCQAGGHKASRRVALGGHRRTELAPCGGSSSLLWQ